MKRSLALLFAALTAGVMAQTSFDNLTNVRIPGTGTGGSSSVNSAGVYPITFAVSGMGTTITDIDITLNFGTAAGTVLFALGEEHTFCGDLDMMLVSPTGTSLVFLSDAGSFADMNGSYTFDDEAAETIQESPTTQVVDGNLVNGSYRRSAYIDGDPFLSPAPSPNFANIFFSAFDGQNPNGTWELYIMDDAGGDAGWLMTSSLTVTAVPEPATMAVLGLGVAALLRRRRRE